MQMNLKCVAGVLFTLLIAIIHIWTNGGYPAFQSGMSIVLFIRRPIFSKALNQGRLVHQPLRKLSKPNRYAKQFLNQRLLEDGKIQAPCKKILARLGEYANYR